MADGVLIELSQVAMESAGLHQVTLLLADGSASQTDLLTLVTQARPRQTELAQNYPNPFNPSTTIPFAIGPEFGVDALVRLDIYDLLGQRIRGLANGWFSTGMHQLTWDGLDQRDRAVASGLYLYRLEITARGESEGTRWRHTRRLMLVR